MDTNSWLRRLRGALGMGLTWAGGGVLIGGVMEAVANFFPALNTVDMWIPLFAIPGFIGGMVFSVVLAIAGRNPEVPGSSEYVDRGVVVYSNQSKVDLLDVPAQLIDQYGAVSEPVAEAMASGIVRKAGTDLGVSVTGIAGPSGGTAEKPVGMVVIAAAWARGGNLETRVRTFNFIGGRDMVRFQASQAALDMVRRWLNE